MTTPGEAASGERTSDSLAGTPGENSPNDDASREAGAGSADAPIAPTRRSRREERTGSGAIPRRYSDTLRANIAGIVGVIGGTAIFVPVIIRESERTETTPEGLAWLTEYTESILIPYYMVFWVLFVAVYIAWTHLSYARTPRPELVRISAVQSRHRPSLLSRMFGYGGAGSWTVAGALVAAILAVGLARTEMFRSEPVFILLGMATVAASWFAMVYS